MLVALSLKWATGKPPWSQQYQEVAALFHIGTTKSHPPIPEHLSTDRSANERDLLVFVIHNLLPCSRFPFYGIEQGHLPKMAVFVSSRDALQPGWLLLYLRSVAPSLIKEKKKYLAKYSRHFLYSSPAQSLGPEDLTWRMIAGKLVNIRLQIRRSQCVVPESRSLCTCDCRHANFSSPHPIFLHPFLTGDFQEPHLVLFVLQFRHHGLRTLNEGLKDICNMGCVRCSTVYPEKFSKVGPLWGTNSKDDDMCQIDDANDFAIGTSEHLNPVLLSDDFKQGSGVTEKHCGVGGDVRVALSPDGLVAMLEPNSCVRILAVQPPRRITFNLNGGNWSSLWDTAQGPISDGVGTVHRGVK
ncbi:hypothetical protein Ancab_015686 [Ancistrocladus abbreviatus]